MRRGMYYGNEPSLAAGQRGRSEDAEQGVGVRLLMALLGGSGTSWPAHKLFTTNNTDPDESYLGTLHRATARRMRGRGMERLGDLEVGMPPSCPWSQKMSMPWESSVTSLRVCPRQHQATVSNQSLLPPSWLHCSPSSSSSSGQMPA